MKRVLAEYREIAYVSILVLCGSLLWLPRLRGPIDLRYDAGVYYILGASLAEGKGYRLLNEPGQIHAVQYPPLLPLFAAIHQRVAGSSDPAKVGHLLRISFVAILLVFIVAAYFLTRQFLTPALAFLAALGTLLHVQTLWMSELFFADLPFAVASLLFLLAARSANDKSRNWLAGAMAVTGFLLRSSGIALLGAWVGESLLERRFKQMIVRAAVAVIPVVAWQTYIAGIKHGPEYAQPAYPYQRADYQYYNAGYLENLAYLNPFQPELGKASVPMLARRAVGNLISMPKSLGEAVSVRSEWATLWFDNIMTRLRIRGIPVFLADVLPFLLLGTLVVFGLVVLTLRSGWLLTLYIVGSGTLICLTPWPGQFARYWWPLTPLLFTALFSTLTIIGKRFSTGMKPIFRTPAGVMILLVGAGVFSTELLALRKVHGLTERVAYRDQAGNQHEYNLLFYTADWQQHDAALHWLEEHAGPNEVVATSTPHWVYIKAGLTAVMPPFEANAHEAQKLMDSVPISYLIIDGLVFSDITRRYAAPVVEAYPERWELVYSSAGRNSRIYRRTKQNREWNQGKASRAEFR